MPLKDHSHQAHASRDRALPWHTGGANLVSLPSRMAAVCPGHYDSVHHLQCAVPLPVLLPALHHHQRGPVLPHWDLPDSCW